MSKITGWVKCPICEGLGTTETEKSKATRLGNHGGPMLAIMRDAIDSGVFPDALKDCHMKFEPCPTCKDSKFKGCLPIDE